MAYVHCHGCKWEQDDFWELRGYNPLRTFLRDYLPMSIRPHMMEFDRKPYSFGRIFSWVFLAKMFVRMLRRFANQKWWTYRNWREAVKRGRGSCPKCGEILCID